MKLIMVLCLIVQTGSFVVDSNFRLPLDPTIVYYPCNTFADQQLGEILLDIFKEINSLETFNLVLRRNLITSPTLTTPAVAPFLFTDRGKRDISVCVNARSTPYGVSYFDFNDDELFQPIASSVWISHLLLASPNTLYDVLYHEILHTIGLLHSDNKGLMNTSITKLPSELIKERDFRAWPSMDDIAGIRFMHTNKRVVEGENAVISDARTRPVMKS